MAEQKTEQRIWELLRSSKEATITDVSKNLGIHYITASKYMAVMEAGGKIECKRIGMAKLFRLKEDKK